MRRLPTAPVFTFEQASALGWTFSALRHAVATGRLIRVRRGLYTSAPTVTPELAAIAAARSYPRCVISHRSAVLLHGLPLLGPKPPLAEITVPLRWNGNAPGVHLHRARTRDGDVVVAGDTYVTSVARTIIDTARHHSLRTAVVAADAALHRRLVTRDQIDDVVLHC